MLADGTKQFDLTAAIVDWEVAPGKIVEAWTYNGIGSRAGHQGRASATRSASSCTTSCPSRPSSTSTASRSPTPWTASTRTRRTRSSPGETFTYEFTAHEPAVGMYHSHHNAQLQVPNGLFGAFLIGEMPLPAAAVGRATPTSTRHVNMVLNDAGTIGLSLNGKSFPATEPYTLQGRRGRCIVNYFNEGLQAHPMHLHQPVGWIDRQGRRAARRRRSPATRSSSPPASATPCSTRPTDPGVWVWHCHILNHAEGPTGHVRHGHRADRRGLTTTAAHGPVENGTSLAPISRSRLAVASS